MHIHRLIGVLTIAAIAALSTSSSRAAVHHAVPSDIERVFSKPAYRNAVWGLRVMDGPRVLVDFHSGRQLFIGSVRKIFSVGSSLNAVGATHTYDTPVFRQGAVDSKGTLHGNLVLVASGDLTMGGRTNADGTIAISNWDHNEANSLGNAILTRPNPLAGYARLARSIRQAGIKRVDGDVVIDDRLFDPFKFRGEFNVRPIFVNDDVVDVSMLPPRTAAKAAAVSWRPRSSALAVSNRLTAAGSNAKSTVTIDPELPQCIGQPRCTVTVRGALPRGFMPPLTGGQTLVQTARIVQPSNFARTVFVEALGAAGVTVSAPVVEPNPTRLLPKQRSYASGAKVAQLTGMPYGQDAKFVLKISYNIGADTSLVLFGLTRGQRNMQGALRAESSYLSKQFGIAPGEYHFVDGSGGGDSTATNVAVTKMLEGLAKAREHQAFFDALPILGVDGSLATVKNFQNDPTLRGAKGQVRAKTGTYVAGSASGPMLKGQAYGGYVTSRSGKHLTFELVVNNMPIKGIPDLIKVFEDEGTIAAMLWRDY